MSPDNLIWIDLEMTGLDSQADRIIEIATIVTDSQLNLLAEGPVLAINQSEAVLAQMDDWNQKQHGESGLISRVRASVLDEATAEALTLDFLGQHVAKTCSDNSARRRPAASPS
jgi:oligoribonuclease